MKDALLVAYHYPPVTAGAARVQGFERHLPEFGYCPHILTTATFGSDLQPFVYRAHEILGIYRFLFNRKQAALDGPERARDRTHVGGLRAVVHQIKRLFLIPDGQMGWLPHALWVGLGLIRRRSISVIYSTGPPFSSHILGMVLQAWSGLPWVADFRDTWTYDPLDEALLNPSMRKQVEARLESMVIHRANGVVAVTDVALEAMRSAYPNRADRIRLIPNGFEPEGIARADNNKRETDRLRLVYTGSFAYSHGARSPRPPHHRCPHEPAA